MAFCVAIATTMTSTHNNPIVTRCFSEITNYIIVPMMSCVYNPVLFSFQIVATLVVLQGAKLLGIINFDDINLANIKKVSSYNLLSLV